MKTHLSVAFLLIFALGCAKKYDSPSGDNAPGSSVDIQEWGQQVGDVMASMDEAGGSGAVIADRTMDRLGGRPGRFAFLSNLGIATAQAASCYGAGFSPCTTGVIVRTFGGCTIGSATFQGSVLLTWSSASNGCILSAVGDSIKRSPDFTVTGRRNATLTVSKSGTVGQMLTWKSGTGTAKVFDFSNDGIRRVFRTESGTVLFDYTTTTSSNIKVTGTTRADRTITDGVLQVTNNLNGTSCDLKPTDVHWTSSTCNCADSGKWSGKCTDGKDFTLTITGCGSATLQLGTDQSQSFSFDRCSAS